MQPRWRSTSACSRPTRRARWQAILRGVATAARDRSLVQPRSDEPMFIKSRVGAIILIVLGVLFLLSNLGMLPRLGPLFAQWWPLILIIVGASLLMRR